MTRRAIKITEQRQTSMYQQEVRARVARGVVIELAIKQAAEATLTLIPHMRQRTSL